MAIIFNHHQWGVAFGVLGNIVSVLVYLAPVPTFYRIYRKKSTESFQSLPYLVALFSSMLWFYYALLKGNAFLVITINTFGCIIETIYIIIFITYATKESRKSTIKIFGSMNVGGFSLILLITHFLFRGSIRIQVLGWICVAFSVSVFAAPLSILAQVIRTKSVEFMPFNLSFFLTLNAIMWFAYGLFLKDICIALPNIVGFILGLLQMLLYSIYKNANKVVEEKKLPEPLKNIVILGNLGASEVFPVDIQPDSNDVKQDQYVRDDVKEESTKRQEQKADQEPQKHDQKSSEVSSDGAAAAQQDECPV